MKNLTRKKLSTLWKDNRQFVIFILLMSVFRSAVADWYTVPTGSMQPTIEIGDRISVNKMAYDLRIPFTNSSLLATGQPEHGDIVVFESAMADERLIKRVIGLPGDIVEMRDEQLIVNGKPLSLTVQNNNAAEVLLSETNSVNSHTIRIDKSASNQLSSFAPVTVPDDHYLVLGDNRRNSADSRVYGFVPRHELKGKAQHVVFSLDYDNYYLPRKDRLSNSLY